MPIQLFLVEATHGAAWPEIRPECGAGVARILQAALEQSGVDTGTAVTGRMRIGDGWHAELLIGDVRHEDAAEFGLGHHLLFRLAEFAAKALGGTLSEAAGRAFADLATHSPGALLAYLGGRFQRAFELDPHLVAARVALARAVLARGASVEAAQAAASLVRDQSIHDGRAAAELGLELFSTGENEVAADLLQAAIRAQPNDAIVMAALASLLARRLTSAGEDAHAALDEAQLLATQATQLAADDFRTWTALAEVHRARADFSQAGFYYGFALRLAPDAGAAIANLLKDASATWIMAGQPAQALPLIERALTLAPADADHHGNLAFARARLGEATPALHAARQASKLRPDDARLRILHGDLALAAGHRDEALEAWARAAELDPGLSINPEGGNVYAQSAHDRH